MSQNPTLDKLYSQMTLPVIAAPMRTISNPEFALEFCKNGVIGSLQALNAKTSDILDEQLSFMNDSLEKMRKNNPDQRIAPYAVNIIVNDEYAASLFKNLGDKGTQNANKDIKSRLETDIDVLLKHIKDCNERGLPPPIPITSMGAVKELVDKVHNAGGIILHDVTKPAHARNAARAGVDGIIAIGASAGGNGGTMSPFALVGSIRSFFNGIVVLGGAINSGSDILAAQTMGADFAYMGTRMIATKECPAAQEYKQEIVDSRASDIIYTNSITGQMCRFLSKSVKNAGYDVTLANESGSRSASLQVSKLEMLERKTSELIRKFMKQAGIPVPKRPENEQRWVGIRSAGEGVENIHDVPSVADLIDRMKGEYTNAKNRIAALDFPAP